MKNILILCLIPQIFFAVDSCSYGSFIVSASRLSAAANPFQPSASRETPSKLPTYEEAAQSLERFKSSQLSASRLSVAANPFQPSASRETPPKLPNYGEVNNIPPITPPPSYHQAIQGVLATDLGHQKPSLKFARRSSGQTRPQ